MEMLPEVAEVRPVLVALSVNVPPVPVISHPAKVATPLDVLTGLVVQFRVPVPEAMERVTDEDGEGLRCRWRLGPGPPAGR